METITLLIFLGNSILFPLSFLLIFLKTRHNFKVKAISYYATINKKSARQLMLIIFIGNSIQLLYSLYLYFKQFPIFILFGVIAGICGIIVSFLRIDKHYKIHILLTFISLIAYTSSIFLTSLSLQNNLLILLGTLQLAIMILGNIFKIGMKYLEVSYFIIFGIWNICILLLIKI